MTRDLEEERKIDALAAKKAESLRKKREYKEGVEKRCKERLAKKAEKQARKDARTVQLASLVLKPSRRTASTQQSILALLFDAFRLTVLSIYSD